MELLESGAEDCGSEDWPGCDRADAGAELLPEGGARELSGEFEGPLELGPLELGP